MASVDLETIQQDLARRFAAPLPEFYQRRIIFWYDEEREFEDQIGELALDGVTILALTGSNTFAVKKQLCEDDLASNYLVYDPRFFTKDDDNWLINVQLYSEEFRADLNSIWMDEMGLPTTPIIRSQVKRYRKFFRSQKHRCTDFIRQFGNHTVVQRRRIQKQPAPLKYRKQCSHRQSKTVKHRQCIKKNICCINGFNTTHLVNIGNNIGMT